MARWNCNNESLQWRFLVNNVHTNNDEMAELYNEEFDQENDWNGDMHGKI